MTVVKKFDHLAEMRNMQEEMIRLFDRSRKHLYSEAPEQVGWDPPTDIYEDEREVVIKMELPEVKEEDITVRLEENCLLVEGERKLERGASKESYHRIERFYGPFSRSFSLPVHVDQEQIRAACEEGVLKITLSKKEEVGAKKIDIEKERG
jgi:HSP20 family protein